MAFQAIEKISPPIESRRSPMEMPGRIGHHHLKFEAFIEMPANRDVFIPPAPAAWLCSFRCTLGGDIAGLVADIASPSILSHAMSRHTPICVSSTRRSVDVDMMIG